MMFEAKHLCSVPAMPPGGIKYNAVLTSEYKGMDVISKCTFLMKSKYIFCAYVHTYPQCTQEVTLLV